MYSCIYVFTLFSIISTNSLFSGINRKDVGFQPILKSDDAFLNWSSELEEAVRTIERNRNGTLRVPFENEIVKIFSSFFVKAKGEIECKSCKLGIQAAHRATQFDWTLRPVVDAIDLLCRTVEKKPNSVCKGVAQANGPTVYKILRNIDASNTAVTSMACYAFGNICPMPVITLEQLALPARINKKVRKSNNKQFKYVLHISDLHYDREYKEGAEASCSKPICCQADSNSDEKEPNKIHKPASKWGEYTCDASQAMLNSLLNNAALLSKTNTLDMVLFTGDLPAHDLWKEELTRSEQTEIEAYKLISQHFSPTSNSLYPVIGNHESVPLNQFPYQGILDGKDFYLYKFIADQWKNWLPESSLNSVRSAGFYSIQHSKYLKILVLNTNLYYTYNYYALLDYNNSDPNGMFKWMIKELQDAENNESRVYITSHIPPGSTDFYQHWSESYNRIIERYAHVISGQFFGHLHTDEFEIFYKSSSKNTQTAISIGYLAPSMSTMNGINPSFRIYKVDADTFEVVDYTQYYADLKKQSSWKSDIQWEIMYNARQTYGFGSNTTSFPTLNGAFWHRVTEVMERDASNLQNFIELRNARGQKQEDCDKECQDRLICTLRAGKSRDNCALVVPFS